MLATEEAVRAQDLQETHNEGECSIRGAGAGKSRQGIPNIDPNAELFEFQGLAMTHVGENSWSSFDVVGVDGISVIRPSSSSNTVNVLNLDYHRGRR